MHTQFITLHLKQVPIAIYYINYEYVLLLHAMSECGNLWLDELVK